MHFLKQRLKGLFCLSLLILFSSVIYSQETLTAETLTRLNIRQSPSTQSAVVTVLNAGTTVIVDGRNEHGDWLLVHTEVSQGWAAAGFLRLSRPVRITDEIPFSNLVISTTQNSSVGSNPVQSGSSTLSSNTLAIYGRGVANGMNSGMFIKIGDSNIAQMNFLCNIERDYYDLGSYIHLQEVVRQFKPSGAFCHDSVAANPKFTTLSVLDPTWAPANLCEPNETPLMCEIRRSKPAFAFIYLGSQDLEVMEINPTYTQQMYTDNLETIVEILSEEGVVPILATFVSGDDYYPDGAPSLNRVIRNIARTHRIPLIDIQMMTAQYANRGAASDGYHLSTPENGKTDFNGNEHLFARTRFELAALELLYDLTH